MKHLEEITNRLQRIETILIDIRENQRKKVESSQPHSANSEPHLTIRQAARFLKVTTNTIHQWSNKGFIKKRRIKGTERVYFLKSELIKAMK